MQDSSASFGGDPRTVTVGGQSAGTYSALSLALDPATDGSITQGMFTCSCWVSRTAPMPPRLCGPCRPSSYWTPTAASLPSSRPRATRLRRCTRSSAPPACPVPGNRPSPTAPWRASRR
nr:carboxylesterase family protein [Streptomyces roseirectus]